MKLDASRPLDAVLVGRAAIDINPADFSKSFIENTFFNKYVGGSPANTAVGMAKLGCRPGFIGRVSDDSLGDFVVKYLSDSGVDTSNIKRCENGEIIGLSFIETLPDGSSNLMMYRNDDVADLKLCTEDVDEKYIASAKLMVLSGTSLSGSPSREAALKCLILAKKAGTRVVFDIDYRPQTWKSRDEISVYYTMAANFADIIVGSREEFDLMDSIAYKILPFMVKSLKSTGGGDAYASAFLSGLLKGLPLNVCLERGTASASIAVAANNCSEALPDEAQLSAFIEDRHSKGEQAVFEI